MDGGSDQEEPSEDEFAPHDPDTLSAELEEIINDSVGDDDFMALGADLLPQQPGRLHPDMGEGESDGEPIVGDAGLGTASGQAGVEPTAEAQVVQQGLALAGEVAEAALVAGGLGEDVAEGNVPPTPAHPPPLPMPPDANMRQVAPPPPPPGWTITPGVRC